MNASSDSRSDLTLDKRDCDIGGGVLLIRLPEVLPVATAERPACSFPKSTLPVLPYSQTDLGAINEYL